MAEVKKTDLQVTSFYTQITSSCWAGIANQEGLTAIGFFDSSLRSTPPQLGSIFSPGCIMINKSGTSTSTVVYVNAGTTAWPSWTVLNIN